MGALTPNLSLTVPTVGGDTGPLFAQEINGDLTLLDSCMGGVNSLNVGGNVNVTLNTSQSQNLIQLFTGTLTGNITVFLPATGRFYAIENATTGAFSLSVGCTGGGNVQQIPQGLSTWVWTDGTFTRLSNPPGWQEIATYSISGASVQIISFPGPFRRFRLTLQNLTVTATTPLMGLLGSSDGGSTFVSTGYADVIVFAIGGATAPGIVTNSFSGAGTQISPLLVTTGWPFDATYEFSVSMNAFGSIMRGRSFCVSSTAFAADYYNAAIPVPKLNAIRLSISAGTFSGTAIVEGLP